MKKLSRLLCISFITLFFENTLQGQQSAFYDAKYIYDSCFDKDDGVFKNRENLYLVLKKYFPSDIGISEADLRNNPFFIEFVPVSIALSVGGEAGAPFKSFGFSSIGGLDVTKFANAIADIMIERAKQELTIAFFDRFKKFAKNYPEFQILFPHTTANLSNLLTYSYPQMLPVLRNGFFEDLEKITYHLDDVLELPKYRHLLNNFPQVSVAIRSIRLIHELETGSSTAADVIKNFADFEEWEKEGSAGFKNMGSTIKFASIFSESLRYKDDSRIWVSNKDIKDLISDVVLAKIYMGLIYQQIKIAEIKFYFNPQDLGITTNLTDIIAEHKDNILLFQNKVAEFINLTGKVMDSYLGINIKKDAGEKISNDDIYNYINVSIDVTDYAFSIVKIFNENLVADKYLIIARKSNALYKDIYSKQYTQAVNDAIDILTEVHELTNQNTEVPAISRKGVALDKKPALDTLITFIRKVKPYALFMANMVEAKDEAGVKAALENVILPVGSSSIKKNSLSNISVQTYLGAYLSTSNRSVSSGGVWSDKFGVTAPIGISWTPSFGSWQKAGSLSLFGSLFDLGAIVDYKLKKDSSAGSVSKEYKVELGQIFSPGIYAVYGFAWNLPLAFGFGAQYGPGLSKINGGGNTVIGNPSVRWNLFLAVDMPFFTLKNINRDFRSSKK